MHWFYPPIPKYRIGDKIWYDNNPNQIVKIRSIKLFWRMGGWSTWPNRQFKYQFENKDIAWATSGVWTTTADNWTQVK